MGGLHLTVDTGIGRHHEGARLFCHGSDIPADEPIDPQSTRENHIALDARGGTDEAVDPVLRLARFVEHRSPLPFASERHGMGGARLARTSLVNADLYAIHPRF